MITYCFVGNKEFVFVTLNGETNFYSQDSDRWIHIDKLGENLQRITKAAQPAEDWTTSNT